MWLLGVIPGYMYYGLFRVIMGFCRTRLETEYIRNSSSRPSTNSGFEQHHIHLKIIYRPMPT